MPVAAVIPAKDESAEVTATVDAIRVVDGVDLVVVVDDGSTDDTSRLARDAGACVVTLSSNRGKGAALTAGVLRVAEEETRAGLPVGTHALLFVDADLGGSAVNLAGLVAPVLDGRADLTIANLPPQATPGGGHGLVVTLARTGIERLTGWRPTQPLSGMRCLTRAAYDAAQPLAAGWGVETAMTIDVLRAGLHAIEVPCDLHHRVSGAGWRAQLHRAGQYRDVWRALLARGYRGTGR